MTTTITKEPLYAEIHNVPDDYHFTDAELESITAGDMFTPLQGAIMARELQERRKAALDAEPVAFINGAWTLVYYRPPEKFGLKIGDKLYTAPPAPVVPDEMYWQDAPVEGSTRAAAYATGWNACRAAMLNHSEHERDMVEPVSQPYKLSFDQWMSQQEGYIDVECGCVMTEVLFHWMRVAYEAGNCRENEDSSTKNFRELAETSTKCWCHTCRPVTISDMRFVVCPECGNKRCPKANDHRHSCTGSNEPGQEGSAYPAAPQQEGV